MTTRPTSRAMPHICGGDDGLLLETNEIERLEITVLGVWLLHLTNIGSPTRKAQAILVVSVSDPCIDF